MNRNRFRRANSSLPGYDDGAYDLSDHPASQAQPSPDQYGIDSEFGEGVRQGPYKSGPAPASGVIGSGGVVLPRTLMRTI